MRTREFALQPHPNSSRSGDRPQTYVDKPWSSLVTRSQPEHAQICNCRSRSGHAMTFVMHFILELTSDVSTCTKYRPRATCASYNSHRNSMWSLSFSLHLLFRSFSDPMMTSGSLLPMMRLISSRARLTEVAVRHVECSSRRNRHPVQRTVLNVCNPHCFLTGPVQCLLRSDSNCMSLESRFPKEPSRNVQFSGAYCSTLASRGSRSSFCCVIPTGFGVPHCCRPRRPLPSRRRRRCVPHCLLELRSSCRCPGRCL